MLNVVVWFSFKGVFNCWIWSSSHTRVKIKNACIMPKREPGYYISIREDFLQQACSQFWHCQFWRQKVKEKYPTDWLNKAMELDASNWHNMNIEDPPEFFFGAESRILPFVCRSYILLMYVWKKYFFLLSFSWADEKEKCAKLTQLFAPSASCDGIHFLRYKTSNPFILLWKSTIWKYINIKYMYMK